MGKPRRGDRWLSVGILPAVLVAVAVLAYFTFRTTLQLESLRRESVLEATLGLATEKADRLDKRIITEDNVAIAVADPAHASDISERWLPTAQRETPTIRAILVLDDARNVISFASRAGGAWSDEETFRRLLVERMLADMELGAQPVDQLRHLHREYRGQGYLVSYWKREVAQRRYLVVAWHDVGRIVKDTLPSLYTDLASGGGGSQSRVNVVDEDGRIVFGPPLRSGEFTVGVRFPTTLYDWRLQVSPSASEELADRVRARKSLELVYVSLSCLVIVAGVAAILLAVERERRLNALKSEFIANVSHELKTPLALVRMFAEMLQTGRVPSDVKRQEYLDIIVGESERLSALIENVLDFAQLERGKDGTQLVAGHVGEVVSRAVSVMRHRAEREGVSLAFSIEDDLPETLIDDRALQLAVMNLIDNALKYACGDAEPSVLVRVRRSTDFLEICVVDRGPGVAPEERARIFERFERGRAARGEGGRAAPRGSGIGLSLVQHIATTHGGRAWVETGEGGCGSAFVLSVRITSARGSH